MLPRRVPKSIQIEPQGSKVPPPHKNEDTTFVAYKAPKIKAPRPAPNYQRNTRKKGLNIRKKILTRLWAFGPANFLQKDIFLKGFRQNGYQIRIQRKKLNISALVKINFGYLFEKYQKCQKSKLITLKTNKNKVVQAWGV